MSAAAVQLEIPRDILDSAQLSLADLKVELALHLYAVQRLGIGKAHELAGLSLWEFRQLAAVRHIPAHCDQEDLEDDMSTLHELGRL